MNAPHVATNSSNKCDLKLDWCSYEAARYAVEHWHYSRSMPGGKHVKIGVWENKKFIGAVIYAVGANKNIGSPYGLAQTQVCELVRVALTKHETPVSRIVAISLKMLHTQSPGLLLVVSYADPNQGHLGSIYQAGNWIYTGKTLGGTAQIKLPNGQIVHKRTVFSRYGTNEASKLGGTWVQHEEKHKYLYPLTPEMKAKIEPLRQPYPKPASETGDRPDLGRSGRALLTQTLSTN